MNFSHDEILNLRLINYFTNSWSIKRHEKAVFPNVLV